MRRKRNDATSVGEEVLNRDRLVVLVEREVADPSAIKVGMEIRVLKLRREIIADIPDTADRTLAAKLRTGYRGSRRANVADRCVSVDIVGTRARRTGWMFPINRGPCVDEARNRTGNLL